MKVTLRQSYSWKNTVLEPSEAKYNPEFFTAELDYKDVLEILRVQVEMEVLQQRLQPIYEAMEAAKKAADEAKIALEELEKEGEELPTTV